MKKIIVNGVCASLVCFMLSSFSVNSNNLSGTTPGYAPLQDTTTHNKMGNNKMGNKKKMKMDKTTGDTSNMEKTTGDKKMKMKKKPA